jgi:hypothetical protein
MKWCSPFECIVGFQFHAEKRIGKACKVVGVDAGIYEGRWKAQLPNVIFHSEFARPQGQRRPVWVVNRVVWHTAVDEMLHYT